MAKDHVAVLQFEIDRKRWLNVATVDVAQAYTSEKQSDRLHYIARTAISDTIRNGGTFVLVADADKITMVQRSDVEKI